MLQVPQPPPSTLLIVMPFIDTGELSTWVPRPMPCCSAAINANTLNDDPVGQPRLREVEAVGVRSAVVRLDPAGLRVDRHDRGAHVRVLAVEIFRRGFLGGLLRLGVDRRGDLQALGVQGLLVDVEELEKLLLHLAFDQAVRAGGLVL